MSLHCNIGLGWAAVELPLPQAATVEQGSHLEGVQEQAELHLQILLLQEEGDGQVLIGHL